MNIGNELPEEIKAILRDPAARRKIKTTAAYIDSMLKDMQPEIIEVSLSDPDLMDKLRDYHRAGWLIALTE